MGVPLVGRVVAGIDVSLPYRVVDQGGVEVAAVSDYLRHATANDFSRASVESYARALLRWWRFLWGAGVPWDRAGREVVRDFVLWMRSAAPARPVRREGGRPGGVNARTGKRQLGASYAPATINHNLAVVSAFYDYQLAVGCGPVRNPVPVRVGRDGGRAGAHGSPAEPVRSARRAPYRQRVPRLEPRAIPDGMFDELFTGVPSDRDRALLAMYVSTGARPAELLGVSQSRLDYGERLVGVVRKGTRTLQWLPASPDAFVWLRLYQQTLPPECSGGALPVWWTLRRPWRRLDYEAFRAVLRRANQQLRTNWTLHDLRHTYAVRMANDPNVPLVSLQVLLGHAHLSTTQQYLRPHLDEVVAHARRHHRDRDTSTVPAAGAALGYDDADLRVLFGWQNGPGAQR